MHSLLRVAPFSIVKGEKRISSQKFEQAVNKVLLSDTVADATKKPLITPEGSKPRPPLTVTGFVAERSAGGIHDFYSEGDYWWPDPENPDGPYIRRDGVSNPDNFAEHRKAMIDFSMAEDGSFPQEPAAVAG